LPLTTCRSGTHIPYSSHEYSYLVKKIFANPNIRHNCWIFGHNRRIFGITSTKTNACISNVP
jgi:hypothetical protein